MTKTIPIKLLNKHATLPTYGSELAAGMDLYASESELVMLGVGDRYLVKTGISAAIPEGYYGRIAPRSGLAYKQGIDVLAGVIDADYRGEIGVIIINLGNEPVTISQGDRVAQMIITPYENLTPELVEELDDTERGGGKFGSTGV